MQFVQLPQSRLLWPPPLHHWQTTSLLPWITSNCEPDRSLAWCDPRSRLGDVVPDNRTEILPKLQKCIAEKLCINFDCFHSNGAPPHRSAWLVYLERPLLHHQMLRDITTTSSHINTSIIPCIHRKDNRSESTKRTVKFDAEGMTPSLGRSNGGHGGRKKAEEKDSGDAEEA